MTLKNVKSEPLVSVIIPVYNRKRTIKRSVCSVLNQNYDNIEVIVVDDGSSDGTKEVINKIKDDRIDLIKHDENRGATAARNSGIQRAEGKYIAFQDSDDEWAFGKLRKQIELFRELSKDVGVVYTGFCRVQDKSAEYMPKKYYGGNIHQQLLDGNFVTTQSVVVRKECFDNVGDFHTGLPRLQDWELWIRMSEKYKFEYIDEPLVITYLQEDSISNNRRAYIDAIEIIIKKHREKFDNKQISGYLFMIGHLSILDGDLLTGRNYMYKSLCKKVELIHLAAFLLSFLGGSIYQNVYHMYSRIISK